MSRVLRIDASSRTEGSHSRELADFFQEQWLKRYPEDQFIKRDVAKEPLPHIEAMTITGYYTPKEQHDEALKSATALSDRLIAEFFSADIILIDTPMYNYSMPSALKAYIDQVVRVGHTFGVDENKTLFGMVSGKKAFVITVSGLMYGEGPMVGYDFLNPYLSTLLKFLGISEVEMIGVEGSSLDESLLQKNKAAAKAKITSLIGA